MKNHKPTYKHNSGFNIPEDYFSNVEKRVMLKIGESESSKIPVKQTGMSVPAAYFDSLEDEIIAKTKKPDSGIISLFRRKYLYYAAAVAAIFILLVGNFFKAEPEQSQGWEDVEISAMENYIDDGYNMGYMELNTTEYSDLVFTDATIVNEEDFNSVDSEAVFSYLDENMEDPTYILE